jgi:thiol-disulfide isomerase/thioredoxin
MLLEVLVFVQEGCPACHEIRPLVDQLAAHYGRCVRTRIVDVNKESLLSDAMQVRDTPTIIGAKNFHSELRMVGAENAATRLPQLYSSLVTGASCPVGAWKGDV